MGQRYAVLISGDIGENGYPEFFFDLVLMRQTLIDNGFAPTNIFVLYGDGADYSNNSYPAARYRPTPAITDLAATKTNINAIFSDLANGTHGRPQLTSDDLLFVWTFDHGSQIPISPGSSTLISTLGVRDDEYGMRADDFAAAINLVPHAYRIICMQQCRSGGFLTYLSSDKTVILTASEANLNAHPTDDQAEKETVGGKVYPHGEFNFYLLAALLGQNLLGNPVNADANGDGFTTMKEVFDYICAHESDTATPQYADGSRHLGERLHLAFADIFMRDNLDDDGAEPSPGGGLSLSPDINHFRNELLDPQATLCSPEAMTKDNLFEMIEMGQPNYIYVRLRNRGYSASEATVKLYWSKPSTLPEPNSWHPLGEIAVPSMAPGAVGWGGPLIWSEGIPERGHYCFVALLHNAQDPAPDATAVTDPNSFLQIIRLSNNAVWKNFDVDNQFAGGYAHIDFQIRGWPHQGLHSDLEIDLRSLTSKARAELRLVKRLVDGGALEGMQILSTGQTFTKLAVDGGAISAIRNMSLHPSDNTKAELQLSLPEDMDGFYELSIRQLVDGIEMGRVTRRLAIGSYPYTGNKRTLEVHQSNCEWVDQMSNRHKEPFTDVNLAIQRGYNGCRYCLPELSTD